MRYLVTSRMVADGFCEQSLCVRQSEDLFGKSVKLGFAQLFRLRCDTLNRCATGDKVMRPFAPISLFVVGDSVFQTLFLVLLLCKLAFNFLFLGLQFLNFFLCVNTFYTLLF